MDIKNKENLPQDTYRHKGMRKRLIDGIRRKGIKDENILEAMMAIPRHFFMDKAFEEFAYRDQPFPIGEDQTISQPFTVAYQTQLLNVHPREHILEIGTGSGYQAAILAHLKARVFTVERQEVLFKKSRQILKLLGYHNIRTFWRDGWKGLPEFAPFHKIIVTAGAIEIPKVLKNQLQINGIMVVPVGGDSQQMHKITRLSANEFRDEILDAFKFVPMLKGLVRKK